MRTLPFLLKRILLSAALLLLFGVQSATATIHYVTPTGSNANDGLSWATAKATVQGAINTYVSGDEIWVEAGTYTLSNQITTAPGLLLYGGFNGTEINHDQRNPAVNVTILNGNNATRILYVPQNSPCTVDGFTFENGNPNNASYGTNYGGAIYVDSNSFVVINDDVFTNNAGSGAAIYGNPAIYGNSGSSDASITNCIFTGNNAASYIVNLYNIGSLVFSNNEFSGNTVTAACVDYSTYSGNLTFTNNTFLNNTGTLPTVVVSSNSGNGTFTITGNTFTGNSSGNAMQAYGGALNAAFNYYNNGNGVMTVADNTFINNSGSWDGAAYLQGSAIYFANTLILTGNIVRGNTAASFGGGIGITGFNQVTIARNSITGNTTPSNGGGLYIFDGSSQLTLEDNLVANNTSGGDGTAIYMNGYNFTINGGIFNNTIVNNRGPASGSAISYSASNLTLANNIIALNTIGILNRDGSPTTLVTNDLFANSTTNYSGLAPGSTDLSVDPLFVNPNNEDYHLASISPVIDAGTDSYVSPGDTDLDGNPRIYGTHVDIGAYEWSPTYPDITAVAVASSTVLGGNTLTGTVTLSGPALSGGATVLLSYSASPQSAVSGPLSVTIPQGATYATFTISTNTVARATAASVSGFYRGITLTSNFTVNPYLASLTLSLPVVISGGTVTGTVNLNGPAPTGGLVVNLTSSMPSCVSVPPSITIPAGVTSGTFSITGGTVTSGHVVTLTASTGPQSVSTTIIIDPISVDVKEVSLTPSTVVGGLTTTGVVTLTAKAPTGGLIVPLGTSNAAIATTPAYVVVAAGRSSASFPVSTSSVAAVTTVLVGSGVATLHTATLTVKPNTITSLALEPSPAEVGDTVIGVVTLALPAPAGGITIPLTVSNSSLLSMDATVYIPGGQTVGTFYAEALEAGSAKVTAKYNGVSTSYTLTITP